jgi:uncharacterized damage-inducible protein DinB
MMSDQRSDVELQSGEDPRSDFAGDAHHWVGVYSELLRLVDDAIVDLGNEHSVTEPDLDAYRQRFERRLAFWQTRSREHERPAMDARDLKRHPTDAP